MNGDIEVEKGYTTKDTVEKLRRLADALEEGKAFEIQVSGERIYVPADAHFAFEYEKEGSNHELELEIKWRDKQ